MSNTPEASRVSLFPDFYLISSQSVRKFLLLLFNLRITMPFFNRVRPSRASDDESDHSLERPGSTVSVISAEFTTMLNNLSENDSVIGLVDKTQKKHFFADDPMTRSGKRRMFTQALIICLVPLLIIIGLSSGGIFVSDLVLKENLGDVARMNELITSAYNLLISRSRYCFQHENITKDIVERPAKNETAEQFFRSQIDKAKRQIQEQMISSTSVPRCANTIVADILIFEDIFAIQNAIAIQGGLYNASNCQPIVDNVDTSTNFNNLRGMVDRITSSEENECFSEQTVWLELAVNQTVPGQNSSDIENDTMTDTTSKVGEVINQIELCLIRKQMENCNSKRLLDKTFTMMFGINRINNGLLEKAIKQEDLEKAGRSAIIAIFISILILSIITVAADSVWKILTVSKVVSFSRKLMTIREKLRHDKTITEQILHQILPPYVKFTSLKITFALHCIDYIQHCS